VVLLIQAKLVAVPVGAFVSSSLHHAVLNPVEAARRSGGGRGAGRYPCGQVAHVSDYFLQLYRQELG